jgi:hypothetical protein
VHSYYPDCHHAVDLFFSGLSAEKKTYFLSANSASRAKWAVKNILSLTRIAKLGPSRHTGRFKGLIKYSQHNQTHNIACISVLPHIGQNYATIPTQNMHFVKGNQRLKLIAANATSSFKMRFRYQRF